jgi:hypothetical protein
VRPFSAPSFQVVTKLTRWFLSDWLYLDQFINVLNNYDSLDLIPFANGRRPKETGNYRCWTLVLQLHLSTILLDSAISARHRSSRYSWWVYWICLCMGSTKCSHRKSMAAALLVNLYCVLEVSRTTLVLALFRRWTAWWKTPLGWTYLGILYLSHEVLSFLLACQILHHVVALSVWDSNIFSMVSSFVSKKNLSCFFLSIVWNIFDVVINWLS